MTVVKISSKNQIVIPKEARQAMRLKGGDEVLVVVKDGITILMPKPENYRRAISGLGKGLYEENYLEIERDSW